MGYWKQFYGMKKTSGGASAASQGDSMTIEIDPTSLDIERIMADLPKKYAKKTVQKEMRTASKPFIKDLRSNLPESFKMASKTVGTSNFKKIPAITAGIQLNKAFVVLRDGKTWDAYYPLYWNNYGTLANRDPQHDFVKKRKSISQSWSGGIRAKKFVQESQGRTESQVIGTLSDSLKKIILEFVDELK